MTKKTQNKPKGEPYITILQRENKELLEKNDKLIMENATLIVENDEFEKNNSYLINSKKEIVLENDNLREKNKALEIDKKKENVNEKLLKALAFYGQRENYRLTGCFKPTAPVVKDGGSKAREVLNEIGN